jgi:ribosome-associated toxin RatA of RatAB toxin-antitoxin module
MIWVLGVSAAFAAEPSLALASGVSSDEITTLKQGQVVVGPVTKVNNMPTVSAKIHIPEPPDKVWKTVSDPSKLMSREEKVKQMKLVSSQGNVKDVEFTVLMSRLLPAFTYTLRHQVSGNNTLNFHRLTGSFKDIQGSWKVVPADGGKSSVLIYNLSIDPGPLVPQNILLPAVKSDLPRMMRNVKAAIQTN